MPLFFASLVTVLALGAAESSPHPRDSAAAVVLSGIACWLAYRAALRLLDDPG